MELVRKTYVPKKYVHLKGAIFPYVAYVDEVTLKGIDRASNEPIQLAWEDSRHRYIEIEGETT